MPAVDLSFQDDPNLSYLGQYLMVLGWVGDRRELAWEAMTYSCCDPARAASPVPPSWDNIVENAPEGYWERQGGVPETVEVDGVRCFPARPAGCGFEELRFVGLGVEGPRELRERGAFIASPFVSGECPRCGLPMSHRGPSRSIDPPARPPTGARMFRVPDREKAEEFAAEGYFGAELVEVADVTAAAGGGKSR